MRGHRLWGHLLGEDKKKALRRHKNLALERVSCRRLVLARNLRAWTCLGLGENPFRKSPLGRRFRKKKPRRLDKGKARPIRFLSERKA